MRGQKHSVCSKLFQSFKNFVALNKFFSPSTGGPSSWLYLVTAWGALKHAAVWALPQANEMGISVESPRH